MKRTQLAAAIILAGGWCANGLAATYSVTPLPLQDTAQNNFARSIDNSGKMLSNVTLEFNPPVDVDKLIEEDVVFDNSEFPIQNPDDVRQGVFSGTDYSVIFNYLIANRENSTGQRLASTRAYITDTVDARLVPGLDVVTETFDDYTQSVNTTARDSLNGDFIVGTSEGVSIYEPYEDEEGETIVYTYRTMAEQAFVEVNGETTRLTPANDLLGGIGHAYAVNNNFQVAGYSTVSFQDSVTESIEECEDPETRGDIPEGLCKSRIYGSSSGFLQQSRSEASVWQLDASGNVISLETFPLLFTPEADDTAPYYTRAYGINNQGVAVGEASTGEVVEYLSPEGQVRQLGRVAAVYHNGQSEEILPREENFQSIAYDINDRSWVTGQVFRAVSSTTRPRLFAINLNTGESRYPDGFFVGSSVDVNAINNNNIVVGRGDFDAAPEATSTRESHAFMYDIQSDTFTDLNDLTACDSPYTLVEAVDINDNNEIIANARIKATQRYISGEEIVAEDGTTAEEDVIIAVKLSPRPNGEVEQCDTEEDEGYEREGAAISPWWLLLLGLAGFRRRK